MARPPWPRHTSQALRNGTPDSMHTSANGRAAKPLLSQSSKHSRGHVMPGSRPGARIANSEVFHGPRPPLLITAARLLR
eukprot:6925506-Pyramimonas_sp.AAC.1